MGSYHPCCLHLKEMAPRSWRKHLGYKTGKKLILLFKRFTSHRCKEKIYKLSKENALKRGGGSLSLFFSPEKINFFFFFLHLPLQFAQVKSKGRKQKQKQKTSNVKYNKMWMVIFCSLCTKL